MDQVVRLIVEESNETEGIPWSPLSKPCMVLASYDTDSVRKINETRNKEGDKSKLVRPAKYALFRQTNREDDGLAAQILLTHAEYGREAVWFDSLYDLPSAIEALSREFPDIDTTNGVSHVIDWPLDMKRLAAGSTLADNFSWYGPGYPCADHTA